MKRRTFIKAIFGTLASVYAPLSLLNAETEAYDPLDLDMGKLRDMGHSRSIIKLIEVRRKEALMQMEKILEHHFWSTDPDDVSPHWIVQTSTLGFGLNVPATVRGDRQAGVCVRP